MGLCIELGRSGHGCFQPIAGNRIAPENCQKILKSKTSVGWHSVGSCRIVSFMAEIDIDNHSHLQYR